MSHRARKAWENAVRVVSGGDHAPAVLTDGDRQRARHMFEEAVRRDPGMADAWLGLHYVLDDAQEALTALSQNASRFGEERRRSGLALASRFDGGAYWSMRLETHQELNLAVAASLVHARDGGPGLAEAYLAAVTEPTLVPYAAFLRGRGKFDIGDWGGAITCFNAAATTGHVGGEARLLAGVCLFQAGVLDQALRTLDQLCGLRGVPAGLLVESVYWRGRVREASGAVVEAKRDFGWVYAQNPGYEDVAERLTAPRPSMAAAVSEPRESAGSAERISLAAALAELDALTGLDDVKAQVRRLINALRVDQAREQKGAVRMTRSLHLLFAGPPGTGKTTVARIVGRIYAAMGLLEGTAFVEASRATMVGRYLGHTAAKTAAVIDSAANGVLFIDEAYQLNVTGLMGGDAFGQEAVGELIARMENERATLAVIAAGYADRMRTFLDANEGLRSRFGTTITFPSYSPVDLSAIFAGITAAAHFVLLPEVGDSVLTVFTDAHELGLIDPLGNGRFARSLFEKATAHLADRLSDQDLGRLDPLALVQLDSDDIQGAYTELRQML